MLLGLLVGFTTAYPFNIWMVTKEINSKNDRGGSAMKRGLLRVWVVFSLAWFVLAVRTWRTWPQVEIPWDNGITSTTEAVVNASLLASLLAVVLLGAFMLVWAAKGFRA
jgi:multisubunit Na+/H+ antiporter MnhB subunit